MRTCPCTDAYFRRAAGIERRQVGATTFLIDPERNTIHSLNPVGAGIWEQMAGAVSKVELVETLLHAFPQADRRAVAKDVTALLDDMFTAGLVLRGP